VSSFSTKLARVNLGRMPGAPAAPGGAATDTRVELDPEERLHPSLRRQDDAHGDARRDAREADGFAAAPARGTSLDELRDRMARILSRQPAPPPPPRRDPTSGELPFVREETPLGPLHVRRRRLSAAHRVGRAPVRAATTAAAPMLALLALDPTLASLDPAAALYVDTETTGLAGGTGTVPFLVGLGWFEPGSGAFVVEQLLLRQRLHEYLDVDHRSASDVCTASPR